MAPNPQVAITERELPSGFHDRPLTGDEVVISGIAGEFPKSENVMELMENLYNKVDMVEEVPSSTVKHPALPKHYGKIKNLDKFDAQFFRVTHWQASTLDPMSRKVMENAFCAIYDSGINPLTLSGSKLGVFVGSSYGDVTVMNLYNLFSHNTFVISGCSKAMLANRISYWIDAKAPSVALDQGCSSSMSCLELAYNSLKRGDVDAVLVGGCNLCVHEMLSIQLTIDGHNTIDGKTKCFDKNGDGGVRADSINMIFLQKAKDAKRIYSEIYHIKGKYFTRPDANFLSIRKCEDIEQFLKEFYEEIKVSPSEVEYVEAFGSGIAEGDGNELSAIGNFFAKSRSINVGCVKSNMGNTEAASGICSLIKLCLAYNQGKLPGNLHYNEPQDHIPAVRDGRIQVVTENIPFNRGFTALNNFSFTGMNFHVLLKAHYKKKDRSRYLSSIPHLILLSGRDENSVNKALDTMKSNPIDPEEIALLHNIYKHNIPGHTGRSYTILDTNDEKETISLGRSFEIYPGTTRPVCFLYSGMGSQWNCMGTELMRIPIFAASIERCRKVLEPLGVDVVKILTDPDKIIFDNIINAMVGIAAIQIGLTDVLKAIGIVPEKIIGHSLGELGCAYADGCITAEEMIISSYDRGLASVETTTVRGSMAAVGLGYNDIFPLCPLEVAVACHNSADSSTISGPADIVKQFVTELTSKGIFAREVACANIAYHSKYIADAGPKLLSSMKKLIKEPKLRSDKWISTSVPQDKWDQDDARYASAEYFTNNLLSPVLFEENAALIPNDAIIIEIAPHSLLQAIIKKSHSEGVYIPVTKRGCADSVVFLLENIGKLFQNGLNPQIDALYPKVEFPVSTETPLLSHLVAWEHSAEWPVISWVKNRLKESPARNFIMSVHDDEYKFIAEYKRNGVTEVPEAAFLVFVWETLAMYRGQYYKDMSVTFHDVTFHNQLKIDAERVVRLRITIQEGSNRFEVIHRNTQIVTGFIKNVANPIRGPLRKDYKTDEDIKVELSGKDIYSLLRMRGYSYGTHFQSIQSMSQNTAKIRWDGEWITFLDSLIQLNAFVKNHEGISTPKIIKQLSIHVESHKNANLNKVDNATCYQADIMELNTLVRCGGVELSGVAFNDIPRLEKLPTLLLSKEFVPHELNEAVDLNIAVLMNLQLVADNIGNDKIKITELVTFNALSLSDVITEVSNNITTNHFDVNLIDMKDKNIEIHEIVDAQLVVGHNLLGYKKNSNILEAIEEDTFIMSLEHENVDKNNTNFKIITTMPVKIGVLVLLKKGDKYDKENVIYIPIDHDSNLTWLPLVKSELSKTRRVVLVSERQPYCGLLGFVKHLKKYYKNKVGLVIVDDYHTSSFNPGNEIYKEQLQKNLVFNVLKMGQWGSYYYLSKPILSKSPNVSLSTSAVGDLDNLAWVEALKQSGNHAVQVTYAGILSKDCEKALGSRKNTKSFGMDFSGINSKGERVMGLVADGALASTVLADAGFTWPIPTQWSLEDAATVPLPYVHAYYCLFIKGLIERNQTVLVTGGAGAFGQALIRLCLSLDCTVFTTVSDKKKKTLLLKLFPKLKEENIAYSRHDTFYATVKTITQNQRCDIVVNCSSGDLREAAMKCVGFQGKFIDVNHEYVDANKHFGMSYIFECKTYIFVDLSTVFKPEYFLDKKALQILMAKGIADGTVQPLTRVVYSPLEVARAFKLVASSKHIGRALITMRDTESLLSTNAIVLPRTTYLDGVHVVVLDLTNIGVELINHLIRKGARKILAHVKKNLDTSYLYANAESWTRNGVKIVFNSENLQTIEGCERLLKSSKAIGPLRSIFIVQDYEEESNNGHIDQDHIKLNFEDTVVITANLDITSKQFCDKLSNFVLVSIASQNIGSEHAISACQRICEARNRIGLPALVLRTTFSQNDSKTKSSIMDLSTLSLLFNAMDISLKSKLNNVLAFNIENDFYSAEDITLQKILDVQDINAIDENLTLNEVNVTNELILEEILSEFRFVNYSIEEMLDMTISRLKQLYKDMEEKKVNIYNRLGVFYNYIDRNEFEAVDPVIPMKTRLISHEEDGYIDRSKNYLFMIPGFDGHHLVFKSIAERLKIQAATLQLPPDMVFKSIPETAQSIVKIIKSQYEISSKFYILGYSFGINVALEVARILEAEGRRGVVYCLDGSPDYIKLQLKAHIGSLHEEQIQGEILAHMFHLMTGVETTKLKEDIEKTNDWTNKIEICLNSLQGLVHFSNEHRRNILESAYKRIVLAREYQPNFKLESDLVLIKGIPNPRIDHLADDYSLSNYTKKEVKVFDIKSDHVTAPYDSRVSNIVNKMLDSTILEEFKRQSLCESYYL